MTEIDPESLLIGVVAHHSRLNMAQALAEKIQPQVLNIDKTDDQTLAHAACANNHLEVLRQLRSRASGEAWCLVLEDDALPIDDFRSHAAAALRYAPAQLVGFYIGRAGNLDTLRLAHTLNRAWVTSDHMVSAVAYAVHISMLDQILGHYPHHEPAASPEKRFTDWMRSFGLRFCYTVPSLVDHFDGMSLIFTDNYTWDIRQLRKAWRVGAAIDWNTTALQY